ncbi:MAG: phasin family protein [Anaerolineae bacterium]|jgi:poly(hydroxyalkanoate) granule-associated protein
MAKVKVNVEEITDEEEMERSRLLEASRKLMLASVGAVALAQDELEGLAKRLVERGQIAEQDGRRIVRDIMERRRRETQRAEDEMEQRVNDLLQRMNVPTKSDIETLSAKIETLSKKVDELKKG